MTECIECPSSFYTVVPGQSVCKSCSDALSSLHIEAIVHCTSITIPIITFIIVLIIFACICCRRQPNTLEIDEEKGIDGRQQISRKSSRVERWIGRISKKRKSSMVGRL